MPEGHVGGDFGGSWRRVWVVPRGVAVDLAVDLHVVVAGRSFPGATGVRGTVAQVLPANVVGRKVVVAFDADRVVALGDNGAVPCGSDHDVGTQRGSL